VLAAVTVISVVTTSVCPGLYTFAMLKVILPFPFILGSVDVLVHTESIRFVVSPKPLVDVSVHVCEATSPVRSVFSPLARVPGPVRPGLLSLAISEASLPLAGVDSSRLELVGPLLLPLGSWIIVLLGDCLPRFLVCEVLTAAYLLAP
jgi:hypothetical protein